jgi:hypothetical protein
MQEEKDVVACKKTWAQGNKKKTFIPAYSRPTTLILRFVLGQSLS